MGRLGRTPAGTATLRSNTKASHFCAESLEGPKSCLPYRRFESPLRQHLQEVVEIYRLFVRGLAGPQLSPQADLLAEQVAGGYLTKNPI